MNEAELLSGPAAHAWPLLAAPCLKAPFLEGNNGCSLFYASQCLDLWWVTISPPPLQIHISPQSLANERLAPLVDKYLQKTLVHLSHVQIKKKLLSPGSCVHFHPPVEKPSVSSFLRADHATSCCFSTTDTMWREFFQEISACLSSLIGPTAYKNTDRT